MARGRVLRDELAAVIDRHLTADVDAYARARFDGMCERYGLLADHDRSSGVITT
jgi:hypothetical protein